MPDSDEKEQVAPGQDAPVTTKEVVRHQGNPNMLTVRLRGEKGQFVKQKKTMPKSEDMTRLIRNLLNQPEAGPDGKMRKGDISRARKILDNIVRIASTDPNQLLLDRAGKPIMHTDKDGHEYPLTMFDAKSAMASTQAFKELWLRGFGMPSKSDEELEAQRVQGVKIVILQHPEMMDKTVVEDAPKPALQPAFAEVTEITTNPKE